ncbi:MAG: FAD-dependent oxidoreductase [Brachymonas sp.]|nr:FAD-dependent oxidoreductase [Brachymonas sp.]
MQASAAPGHLANAPVLIIGAGLAGWTAARELRKLNADLPITLITADSGDFYAKPSLSNALAQKKSPDQLITTPTAQMAQQLALQLMPHTRVTRIDRAAQRVLTDVGDVAYSQLVLATGAQPIRVPLQGSAAQEVLNVNSWDDYRVFYEKLISRQHENCAECYENKSNRVVVSHKTHVLIMGAGLIGAEFANDLSAAGYAVTVVDPSERAIAGLLPPAASSALQEALRAQHVAWKFGQSVQRLEYGQDHRLLAQLSQGEWVTCDLVLSAIGLRPDLSLAKEACLAVERGIVVSERVQTSDPLIYALGDGAQYAAASLGSASRPLPYVLPTMQAAKVLAANIIAQREARALVDLKFPVMPVAIKTPALPLTIAPPAPGTSGSWQADQAASLEWQWLDAQGTLKGFALAGAAAAQRGKWVQALQAA